MPHACTNCGRTFPDGSKEMLSGCPDCGGNKFRYHPESVPESAAGGDGDPNTNAGDDASPRSPPDPDEGGLPGRDRGVVDRATTTVKQWVNQRSDRQRTPASRSSRDTPPSDGGDGVPSPKGPAKSSGSAGSPPSSGDGAASGTTADADAGSGGDAESEAVQASMADTEDTAQADARTGVVGPEEISEGTPEDGPTGPDTSEESGAAGPDLNTAKRAGPASASGGDGSGAGAPGDGDAGAGAATRERPAARERAAGEPADPSATPSASNLAQLREELNEQFESIKIVEPGEYELNLMGLYDREEYIISLMEDGRYAIEVPETWRDAEDLSD